MTVAWSVESIPDRIRSRHLSAAITLDANNTTASEVVFTVTGSVLISAIWAEVTTTIGANHTAGHLRLNDQTATVDITEAATGATLSALAAGTMVVKEGLVADALTVIDNAAGAVEEPGSAGASSFSPFIVVKKTGAVTTIDYRYTTTDTPTTGELTWHVEWVPLSDDGNLT